MEHVPQNVLSGKEKNRSENLRERMSKGITYPKWTTIRKNKPKVRNCLMLFHY